MTVTIGMIVGAVYSYSNGDFYEGEWKDNKVHGKGVYIYSNGDKYEGSFINAMKHGQGKFLLTRSHGLVMSIQANLETINSMDKAFTFTLRVGSMLASFRMIKSMVRVNHLC